MAQYFDGQRVMINAGSQAGKFGSIVGVFDQFGKKNAIPAGINWKTEVAVLLDKTTTTMTVNRDFVETTKICKKCGEERGISQYTKHQSNKDGRENRCTVTCAPVILAICRHVRKQLEQPVTMREIF